MAKLALVFLVVLGVFGFSCSGGSDNDQTSENSNSGANVEPVDTSSEDPEIVCPEPYLYKNDTPAKAALEKACYFTRYIKEIDFQPLRAPVTEETGRTAKVRVVGYSESCERFCPGEVQIRYEAFLTGDEWDAKGVGLINEFIEESDESAAGRSTDLQALVDQTVLLVTPLNPEIGYNGEFYVSVSTSNPPQGLQYRLLVDFPTGETDVIFWPRGLVYAGGVEQLFYESQEVGYTTQLQDINYDWDGQLATIKAYKVIVHQNGVQVEGDWVYLTK